MKRLTKPRMKRWRQSVENVQLDLAAVERDVSSYALNAKAGRWSRLQRVLLAVHEAREQLGPVLEEIDRAAVGEGYEIDD